LEISSVPWEHRLPWFTALVALGVAMELWIIWHDRRDDMAAWRRGVIRPPDRPSFKKFIVEIVSVLFITGGIVGELWAGVKITSINGQLRGESAELRGKSDQLVALLHNKAQQLAKDAEDERSARVQLEASVAWRRFSKDEQSMLVRRLEQFPRQSVEIRFLYVGDPEPSSFADAIAGVFRAAKWDVRGPNSEGGALYGGRIWTPPMFETGIEIDATAVGKQPSQAAAQALQDELCSLGFATASRLFGWPNEALTVHIFSRPNPTKREKLKIQPVAEWKGRVTACGLTPIAAR
jgi:hypothetical protein